MAKKIYVGNLSFQTGDDTLRAAFAEFGEVTSAAVVVDRYTNSSKGFGFVEMASEEAAAAAISGLNEQNLDGRQIRVSEANDKPRERSNDRGGDRGGYGGGRW